MEPPKRAGSPRKRSGLPKKRLHSELLLSCNAKPSNLHHPLISRISWPENTSCYDLKTLMPENVVIDEERDRNLDLLSEKSEDQVSQWLQSLIPADLESKAQVTTDAKTNFLDVPDLFFSDNARAAVCVEVPSTRLPVVCLEVHSGGESYSDTLEKTVAVLIHQLRALRNCDPSIKEVCGFTFPGLDEVSVMTKTRLSWRGIQFWVEFEVFSQVEEARNELAEFFQNSFPPFFQQLSKLTLPKKEALLDILPLSPEDLELLGASDQIPSNSSIVVHCPPTTAGARGKYLKYNPNLTSSWTQVPRKSGAFVLSREKLVDGVLILFDETDEHKQLSLDQVRRIKYDFVKAVSISLGRLHDIDKRAHLDIRLPNICYEDGVVKFIDFDRSDLVYKPCDLSSQYPSEMYVAPDSWILGQLDWKQFGLLVRQIDDSEAAADLVNVLIKEGRWDEGAYNKWVGSAVAN